MLRDSIEVQTVNTRKHLPASRERRKNVGNRYEIGVHAPDFSTAKRLAKVLGVPVAYFYADTERMARLIRAFDRLPASEQEAIMKELEAR